MKPFPFKQRPFFLLILMVSISLFLIKNAMFSYYPESSSQVISITIEFKGTFQEGIEQIITIPLEDELLTLDGLKDISSVSENEKASISLTFEEENDLNQAYLAVRACVERVSAGFPDQVQKPRILKSDSNAAPVFILMCAYPSQLHEEEIKEMFRNIPGTGQIDVGGAPRRDAIIQMDQDKMHSFNLSLPGIASALSRQNRIVSISLKPGYTLTGDMRFTGLDDYSGALVQQNIKLVSLGHPEWKNAPTSVISRVNGEDKTLVWIRQTGDANTIKLCRELKELSSSLTDSEILYNRGSLMEEALKGVGTAILIGILAVFLTTYYFLGSPWNAFILCLNIPFSIFCALGILSVLGKEIDIMVLSGVAVATGLIIDGGVVFLECGPERGRKPLLYSLVSTLLVFSALIFLPLSVKGLFSSIIWPIALILPLSLFYIFFILKDIIEPGNHRSRFQNLPVKILFHHIQKNRLHYSILSAGILILSLYSAVNLNFRKDLLLPDEILSFTMEYPAGTTKETIAEDLSFLEVKLKKQKGIRFFSTEFRNEKSSFSLRLEKSLTRQELDSLKTGIRDMVKTAGGTLFFREQDHKSRYDITLSGHDRTNLYTTARYLSSSLQVEDAGDVVLHFKERPPELNLIVDTVSLGEARLTPLSLFQKLSRTLNHPVWLKWFPPDPRKGEQRRYDVRIYPDQAKITARQDIQAIQILLETGESQGLEHFIDLEERESFGRIRHMGGVRSVSLSLIHRNHSSRDVIAAVKRIVAAIDIPPGITIRHGRVYTEQRRAALSLVWALILAMGLLFLLLLFLFESFKISLILFIQIPFSLLFPLIALRFLSIPLSLPVFFAFILVIGISVNNGIVLFNGMEKEALEINLIINSFEQHGSSLIISLLTTVAGVMPLLFSGGGISSPLGGLSLTVCLGLSGSVLFLCMLTPLLIRE